MRWSRFPLLAVLSRFGRRLRFPQLFGLMGALFLLDLFVPDAIPFVDEVMLGLGTLLVGSLRKPDSSEEAPDTQP